MTSPAFAIFPEVLAVVEVEETVILRFFASLTDFQAEFHRDSLMAGVIPGDMEPIHTSNALRPSRYHRICKRNRRICAVIDDLARQLVCAASGSRCSCAPRRGRSSLCPRQNSAARGCRRLQYRSVSRTVRNSVHAVVCKGDHMLASLPPVASSIGLGHCRASRRFQAEHNFTSNVRELSSSPSLPSAADARRN